MTTEQQGKLDELHAALPKKRADKSLVIDDDTHREFIEKLYADNLRYPGGISLGEKDDMRLTEWHLHYLGEVAAEVS